MSDMTTRPPSGRPADGEFAAYARPDIDRVVGHDAVDVLSRQAEEVQALLARLDDESVRGRTYAPGKWTFKEVVGHLIDDERIFAYRALCVARGDMRPLPGFDEREYVRGAHFEEQTLTELRREYQAVRQATLALFRVLRPEEWLRQGTVNGYTATARGLAFHIAGHELRHLQALREKYFAPAPESVTSRDR